MADNTQLNLGTGGDLFRSIQKGSTKTGVSTIDIGGAGAEKLLVAGQQVAADSIPVVMTALQLAALTPPSGASTAANQAAGNASLATLAGLDFATQTTLAAISGKLAALGQHAAAGSQSVVLASDHATIPVSQPRGNKAITAVAPTSVAAQYLAANAGRISATIANNGTQTVYLGKDNTVTTANGYPLLPTSSIEDRDSKDAWYAITASGTGDLRIVEVS